MRDASAQPSKAGVTAIGFLRHTSLSDSAFLVAALREGLKANGFVEGQNLAMELRFADNQPERLPGLAAELIQRKVSLIVAGGNSAAVAAKKATSTIPIVFAIGADPVSIGLVQSLARPGGNVTGINFFSGRQLGPKRLQIMHELLPKLGTIAYLLNPMGGPTANVQLEDVRRAAGALGLKLHVVEASREPELEAAFQTLAKLRIGALFVSGDAFYLAQRERLVALAARHGMPTSYQFREYVEAGGLMSYGANIAGGFRQAGGYAARILKGAKPGDLPILEPTQLEFVLNLKTAKALRLSMPKEVVLRADSVIE